MRLLTGAILLASAIAALPAAAPRPEACSQEDLDGFAALSLGEKVAAFSRLSPKGSRTGSATERRMECLILSIGPSDLSDFKFQLEYDGDYKDIVEYVFHDIDDDDRQQRIMAHFRSAPRDSRVKVLTDVDDTLFANLVDRRYAKGTVYPGVVDFYAALKQEPFATPAVPVTTLSARPDPAIGLAEEASLARVRALTRERLRPSAQSGALASSVLGTLRTLVRANQRYLDRLEARIPFEQEDKIGQVKFANCQHFAAVFPEYHYVFVGDSGQADALTAQLLTRGELAAGTSRPVTTFIHDLRSSANDARAASPAFKRLTADDQVGATSSSGVGVIVFRNYIDAAVRAYTHGRLIDGLIAGDELAAVTRAALDDFERDTAGAPTRPTLAGEYKADAERAAGLLASSPAAMAGAEAIRLALQRPFWAEVPARP